MSVPATAPPRVGALLRDWRTRRRLSQLDLSLLAALQDLPPADQALLLALAQKR